MLPEELVLDWRLVFLRGREKNPVDTLGQRKLEVARLFAAGMTYKEIAADFRLAPATVRNHIHSVYIKLAVNNKSRLASTLADCQ